MSHNFVWPEFKTDAERIKAVTKKYKGKSILEAFNSEYQTNCTAANIDVKPLHIGQKLEIEIDPVTWNVSAVGIKESITLKQRASKIASMKIGNDVKRIDKNDIYVTNGTVVEINNNGAVIDLIQSEYEDWLDEAMKLTDNLEGMSVKCSDLALSRGGYTCNVHLTDCYEDIVLDGFIPGSQITLNIEKDFAKWNGKTIDAQVMNVINKYGKLSIICSRKKMLQVKGADYLIGKFEQKNNHADYMDVLTGFVTGIINSSKNCGVFIEVPEKNITGMIEMSPKDIVKYQKGKQIKVTLDDFIYTTKRYNKNIGGRRGYNELQYLLDEKTNRIIYCNLKPLFKLV